MKYFFLLILVLCVFSCQSKQDSGVGAGGNSPKPSDNQPTDSNTCRVKIDENSLRQTAISWMRVARECGTEKSQP